ncbi:MAG: N-acetylmuramoyl-L-alanine amidase [Microcoleaceae cyanobacterium]
MGKTLLLRWILPTLAGLVLFTSPVEAARLQSWRFEAGENRLSFTTDGGVQPTAQLLSNPTRLVIDLPGTTLGSVTRQQAVGGAIREIRTGQPNSQTARIVVELTDGYTIDPQQVQFRGISDSEWTVQIPQPQSTTAAVRANPTIPTTPSLPPLPFLSPQQTTSQPVSQSIPTSTQTNVNSVEVTEEGIILRTSGRMPEIEFKQSQDGTWMTVDIFGAMLASQSSTVGRRANRQGVSITQVTQLSTSPPVVRVTMSTPNTQQNWQARSSAGGVTVWPQGATPPAIQASGEVATIQSIELQNQSYFVINADKPLNYTHGWDAATGAYSVTFFSAKLSPTVQLPQRQVGGPLISTQLRQDDSETFTLLIQPATRVQVGQPNQPNANQIIFPMGINLAAIPPAPQNTPSTSQQLQPLLPPAPQNTPSTSQQLQPLLPPRPQATPQSPSLQQPSTPQANPQQLQSLLQQLQSLQPPNSNNATPAVPSNIPQPGNLGIRSGRVLVIVDPGHGGSDVGAVGVGGLSEVDVVDPISREVSQILEQNGVQVVLTRQDNRTVELAPRTQLANRLNATLFVSIHANAAYRAGASGIETFYYQNGYRLAQYIQNSMLANFQMPNRGVKQARFYVLRNTRMPAVLVETGFLTNTYDASILANPAQRSRMAQAIAQGILQYLRDNGY